MVPVQPGQSIFSVRLAGRLGLARLLAATRFLPYTPFGCWWRMHTARDASALAPS